MATHARAHTIIDLFTECNLFCRTSARERSAVERNGLGTYTYGTFSRNRQREHVSRCHFRPNSSENHTKIEIASEIKPNVIGLFRCWESKFTMRFRWRTHTHTQVSGTTRWSMTVFPKLFLRPTFCRYENARWSLRQINCIALFS